MSSQPPTEGDTFLQQEKGHYALNDQPSDSTQQQQNFQSPAPDDPVREQDPNEHLRATVTGQETEEQRGPGFEHGAMADERETEEREERRKARALYGLGEI